MRIALLGCGMMGRGAAYGLAGNPAVRQLVLLDRDRFRADRLARWIATCFPTEVTVDTDPVSAVDGSDAVAMAMPWDATRTAIPVALSAGVPVASITRPRYTELAGLHAEAVRWRGRLLLPLGLEPGLTEVDIRCGGVPRVPRGPLGYTAHFGGGLLPIGQREALTLRAGRPVAVPRFSGVETTWVDDLGQFEAYHDGMVPWLADHPALRGIDATQKTLRWPGFAPAITGLARLGLLDDRPVDVDGVRVAPRRVVERVLASTVAPRSDGDDGDDLVVLDLAARGVVDGRPATVRTTLIDSSDPDAPLSAMARTTGFALAAGTVLLADGTLTGSGWLKPHLAVTGLAFTRLMGELTRRGVAWRPATELVPAGSDPARRSAAGREE